MAPVTQCSCRTQRPCASAALLQEVGRLVLLPLMRLSGVADTAHAGAAEGPAQEQQTWEAHAVSQLAEGARLWVYQQDAARHTGIAIQESIQER